MALLRRYETVDTVYLLAYGIFWALASFFLLFINCGGYDLLPILGIDDVDAAFQVMLRLCRISVVMLASVVISYWVLFVTHFSDSLFRFVCRSVTGITRKAVDDMFFLLMCTTNLGDSLNYINNNNNYNYNYKKKVLTFTLSAGLNLRRRCKFGADYSCWQELQVELMESILQHTDVVDRIRMRTVCKSWESLLKRKDVRVPPQFPWLLLPCESETHYRKNLTFYDMMSHGGRIHVLKLPERFHGGRCFGSSKGWLFMVTDEPLLIKAQIFIFNPISGACHKLPYLRTLPCFRDNVMYHFSNPCPVEYFFDRIELSSEDPSNCIVAGLISKTANKLAFCRVGEKNWGIYEDGTEDGSFNDILFSNNGLLYVIKLTYADQESVGVATHSFTSTDYLRIIPISCSNPAIVASVTGDEYVDAYFEHHAENLLFTKKLCSLRLVESTNGQLLLIHTIGDSFQTTIVVNEEDADASEEMADANEEDDAIEDDDNEEDGAIYDDIDEGNEDDDNEVEEQVEQDAILRYTRTRRFDVYMLDPETGVECMTKLTSLGDQVLLLSVSSTSIVRASDFTGLQENCIYFIESYYNNPQSESEYHPFVSRESGIFYLDDERIERCFPSVKLPLQPDMDDSPYDSQ